MASATGFLSRGFVWKLPMRNPSWSLSKARILSLTCLEATYEESKRLPHLEEAGDDLKFGSYL